MEQAQRDTVRRPLIPIRVKDKEGRIDNHYTDYIIELSKKRIFIRTPKPLPTNSLVDIEFSLKGLNRPISLTGEVVRTSKGAEGGTKLLGAGMGIIFQTVDTEDVKLLGEYLHPAENAQQGKEFESFMGWVRALKAPMAPEEKDKIKRKWLGAVLESTRLKEGEQKPRKKRVLDKPIQAEKIEPLKRIQLFEDLIDEELDELADICHKEAFKAGEIIFEEGAIGDKFYIIQRGEVRISKIIQGIGEEALVVLKEGSYFGEMALIDEAPRSATAICNTRSTLLVIDKENFEQLLSENHTIASKLLWTFVRTLSVRLRETNEKIKSFFAMTGGNQW